MTLFACIGDTHLSGGARNADRLAALDQVIDGILALDRLGAVFYPGDLFDAASSPENRNALDERLQHLAARAPVLIVKGNHDRDGDLEGFARLSSKFPIHVVTDARCLRFACATGEIATVFCLAYPEKATLVSSGVAPADIPQAAAVALDAIFMHAAAELSDARKAGNLTAMIGHGTIVGAISSAGQPMGLERDIVIGADHLSRLGSVAKIFSHIHKPQVIAGVHYIGSICAMDWGEVGGHRWLVVDMALDSSYAIDSRRIETPELWHVEGDLSAQGFANVRATAGPAGETLDLPTSWVGREVRCRCRYLQSEGSILELAQATVKAQFSEAFRFEFEPICVPDRGLRAPEVAAARTPAEKLAAWATVAGVDLPDDVAEKAAALESADADAIVAEVEARMAALADLSEKEALVV